MQGKAERLCCSLAAAGKCLKRGFLEAKFLVSDKGSKCNEVAGFQGVTKIGFLKDLVPISYNHRGAGRINSMRVIIAGSREIDNYTLLEEAIQAASYNITLIVSGGARGVDQLGELWAKQNGVPIKRYPAEWNLYGKSAGPRRNTLMAQNADALIALWNGKSRGTAHMIQEAQRRGLKVFVRKSQ